MTGWNEDYRRIERALRFLADHADRRPALAEVATHVGLSDGHLQRLFVRWAGVSPKQFLQFLTAERAKTLLADAPTVLDATDEIGLSSAGRLHDLMVTLEAVTPGEYRSGGAGLTIRWGVQPTPFGPALVAVTERGVCEFGFLGDDDEAPAAVSALRARWSAATWVEDASAVAPVVGRAFGDAGEPLRLLVRGTNFQLKVWSALLRIPAGRVVSYGHLAAAIGQPTASRAVGTAIGQNPVGYLIPCHRVIQSLGGLGGYRWDPVRKRAMLGWEAARTTWSATEEN